MTSEEIVFDLSGAEPPLANALRRIMIAEIPMMAIEKVTMWQNTSVLPDENLAHRMGLIPIKADARLFNMHKGQGNYTEHDCLQFRLHKKCTKKRADAPMILNETHNDEELYNNANVYSGDLEWIPVGDQRERLGDVRPLHDDILIAKLRPGQEIEMDLICEKGIGKTHAKWSPVCTAYYRMVPDIRFEETEEGPIKGEDAKELKKLCPGVFDIEDIGGEGKSTISFAKNLTTFVSCSTAIVKDPRACNTCRECLRHEKFASRINFGKKKDVFEFHVESLGVYTPQDIVLQSLQILKEKANKWISIL